MESITGALETDLLRQVFGQAGVKAEHFADPLFVDWRDGFWVAVNYSSHAANISVPKESEVLMGKLPLKPADVLLWK